MGRVIVIQFISIDGVVEDPDGSDGAAFGGWAMRHGPQGIAGDKFRLGPILTEGTLLFGRRTWDHFRTLWPARTDDFSQAMNAARKVVATHRPIDQEQWTNSHAIARPLAAWVDENDADIVVIGSGSVVRQLAEADLVDEYRLLTFPDVLGDGRRLFTRPRRLELVSAEQVGPATLSVYLTRFSRTAASSRQ
ncbi:riboflavin biosynthesis protein RibD [Microbacterium protaetiae]|uniref:Riboflavin biosynthesis protein RibD n=1 Tax=Microbacterium protaetiae TaxID=2509458 RepID=A0A4P6EC53_9MICO|nr:dihydrofolate reductase family protein [Microbacterium protaetiae]QAY58569.1 riboflavin biosynthesis protein RibD [Microbacterium protaetiae]